MRLTAWEKAEMKKMPFYRVKEKEFYPRRLPKFRKEENKAVLIDLYGLLRASSCAFVDKILSLEFSRSVFS